MNDRGHLAADTLDRLVLASLPAPEVDAARAHLAACAQCQAAFEALQRDCARFEREIVPRTLPALRERLTPAPLGARLRAYFAWRRMPAWALAGAAIAALVFVAPRTVLHTASSIGDGIEAKGGPALQMFILHGAAVREARRSERVAAGDRLRFAVEPGGYAYLAIASVDGTGKLSLFYPPEGAQSGAVAGHHAELPGSIELDNAPGPERVYACFSQAPLRAQEIARALEGARPDVRVLPAFVLEKVAP